MGDREPQLDPEAERREYSFDEGVQEALAKIQKLLESQDYVVVAITGASTGAGKTHLSAALENGIEQLSVPHIALADENFLHLYEQRLLEREQRQRQKQNTGKGVIIFNALGVLNDWGGRKMSLSDEKIGKLRETEDRGIEKAGRKAHLPLSKIHLRIFVYRPDTPFGRDALKLADIVIKNEKAKDKKSGGKH